MSSEALRQPSPGRHTLSVWRLTIARDDHDGVAVFVIAGRLGTLSSGALVEALAGAITGGERRIVLDLAGVDYASSAGLLALHALLGRLSGAGGTLVLCGLTAPVRIAMELSGLLCDYVEEPSREAAIAQARGTA